MRVWFLCVASLLAIACGSSGGGGVPDASTGGLGGGSGSSGATGGSSGATGGSSGSGGATGGSAGSATGGDAGAAAGGSGGATADAGLMLGPADIACAQRSAEDACIACCSEAHPSWSTVAPATRACVCENPGTCASECAANYCLEQAGSTPCYDCIFPTLAPGAACYAPSQAVCAGNPDCLTYVDCRANCVLSLLP